MNNNLLYVCSPYRGEIRRNKEYARELTKAALNSGFAPVTVHLYMTEVLDEEKPEERSRGMAATALSTPPEKATAASVQGRLRRYALKVSTALAATG